MIRCRTGYSFKRAVGTSKEVMEVLKEKGYNCAPITDTASTFGFTEWTDEAKKAGLRPVYGVELAVSQNPQAKKPISDPWLFISRGDLTELNKLVALATEQFRYQPMLTTTQALKAGKAVNVVIGHRSVLTDEQWASPPPGVWYGLSPAVIPGHWRKALQNGWSPVATGDNRYPRPADRDFYATLCGRNADLTLTPQHILSQDEWCEWMLEQGFQQAPLQLALKNAEKVLAESTAKLLKADLPNVPKPKTLRQMCEKGAKELGVDLKKKVYKERLDYELKLIAEKKFEDYFYIVADLCQWARSIMFVGPARGSSCGSLVCYLLRITTVDPIPHRLIFERFIDITREDLPDIDIDFSDQQRYLVFEYMNERYGKERVARLGTIAAYQPRSALKEVGAALKIPQFKIEAVAESLLERSSGDSRALNKLEDTLASMPAGQRLLKEHPQAVIASRFEGHPRHFSQHAAGVVVASEPIMKYVAVDQRTGATHCDKYDAEKLNLLKIDALGLTQLSVFEDALTMAGLPLDKLESLPLNDKKAFEVLNKQQFSGIFQANGMALQSLFKQFKIKSFEDIVATSALARPGPLASGSAHEWVRRRNGINPVTYPHKDIKPFLESSLGQIIYQEQILEIGRWGGLTWGDTTVLRKAMSRSMGKEFFDQFANRFVPGAVARGMDKDDAQTLWDAMCAYGSWCLSGETRLRNPFKNQYAPHEYITLKELYERQGLCPRGPRQTKKRQKLFMWDGEGLRPYENVDVTYSGRKTTLLVKTATDKSIRATPDHKFLLPDGSYEKLENLKVGSRVMVRGEPVPSERKTPPGTGSGRHNWREHELAGGEFYNGKRGNRDAVMERDAICTECGGASSEECHHINHDHKDHRLENMRSVCRSCHKKLHAEAEGGYPAPYDKGRSIAEDIITFIGDEREEDVYDISMPAPHHNFLAEDFVVHNCFNRSHAVAYGLITYWCCWLKAHYPHEFAAATLTHESMPEKQVLLLREMAHEGIDYRPVDVKHSTDKWTVLKPNKKNKLEKALLLGPLQNIKGVGPVTLKTVIDHRKAGLPMPTRIIKLLENPRTKLDTLYPVTEAFGKILPDPTARNIFTQPVDIGSLRLTDEEQTVLLFCTMVKINPRDENELVNVARRGYEITNGPTKSLNLQLLDDTGQVFGKVSRFKYEGIGPEILDRGRIGKALYAIKGKILPRRNVNDTFIMVLVEMVRYIGDMELDDPDFRGVAPKPERGGSTVKANAGDAGVKEPEEKPVMEGSGEESIDTSEQDAPELLVTEAAE